MAGKYNKLARNRVRAEGSSRRRKNKAAAAHWPKPRNMVQAAYMRSLPLKGDSAGIRLTGSNASAPSRANHPARIPVGSTTESIFDPTLAYCLR